MEPTWSLDQALIWCAIRDADEADRSERLWIDLKMSCPPPAAFAIPEPPRESERRISLETEGPSLDGGEIEAMLIKALRQGDISPSRTYLTSQDFDGAHITYEDDLRARMTIVSHLPEARGGPDLLEGRVEHVRFRVRDVMTVFPSRTSQEGNNEGAKAAPSNVLNGARPIKRGRTPALDWSLMHVEALRLMDHHDDFDPSDPEWNAQSRLEEALIEFAAEKLRTEIGPTSVRTRAAKWIAEWRAVRKS